MICNQRLVRFIVIAFTLMNASAILSGAEDFDSSRYMRVDEIEPGMEGYGLTVFEGIRVESFPVEVVSVDASGQLGKSVIWIRCTGERMQRIGLVRGMSGSPIYLWDKSLSQSKKRLGVGGRLAGAFAFGYPWSKDVYVGVQPIGYMLETAHRAQNADGDKRDRGGSDDVESEVNEGGKEKFAERSRSRVERTHVLRTSLRLARERDLPMYKRWQLDVLAKIAGEGTDENGGGLEEATGRNAAGGSNVRGLLLTENACWLTVPVMVGSKIEAEMLEPYFGPSGLTPIVGVGGGVKSSLVPSWIDPGMVDFEPGGVLSVPMVTGDIDIAASGTITEVLCGDDGEVGMVLAFGHAFSGEGASSVPMGTGFVHFVQPLQSASFKLAGTLEKRGMLVNDELVGVVGDANREAVMCPSRVSVTWPEATKNREYYYEIADDPLYLPILAGMTIGVSVIGDTSVPPHHTISFSTKMKFSGGHSIAVEMMVPEATGYEAMMLAGSLINMLCENKFERLHLKGIETRIDVLDKVQLAYVSKVTLQREKIEAGGEVVAYVELLPFRGERFVEKVVLKIPDDLPAGSYPFVIGGVDSYVLGEMMTHPHLDPRRAKNIDELFSGTEELLSTESAVLYMTLLMEPGRGVAVGRMELPNLPSSRGALLRETSSTQIDAYTETTVVKVRLPYVIAGTVNGQIEVVEANGNGGNEGKGG